MDATINTNRRTNPLKFALWCGMASIIMMFGAFTSAYIVREASGNWLEFNIPQQFYISTIVILLSSLAAHFAYKSFVNGNAQMYRSLLIVALVLGIAFLVFQVIGWYALSDKGVYLNGNPSGSFFYLISGVHAAHVIGGIAALFVGVMQSFTQSYFVNEKRKLRFQLMNTYWHFVDILWIYLFIFFLLKS